MSVINAMKVAKSAPTWVQIVPNAKLIIHSYTTINAILHANLHILQIRLTKNAINAMKIALNVINHQLIAWNAKILHTYMKKNVYKNVLLRISGIYKINVKYVMIIV